MTDQDSKKRAFSLLKTIGSTAIKAGQEAVKKKLSSFQESDFSISHAAQRLARGLDDLKGAAMKMGQLLSMLDDSILPKGWKDALSKLQENATPRPWSEIEPILLEAYGNLDEFSYIDTQAVYAASIAQVHKATLKNGQDVAIKVQYPGLENNIRSDLESMRKLIKLANILPNLGNYDHVFQAAEILFRQELDFIQERDFYHLYNAHFQSNKNVIIPVPIDELSHKNILVTSWIEGISLHKWIESFHAKETKNSQDIETRDALGQTLLEVIFSELMHLKHVQSDPNPGNFLVTPQGKLALLDFGATQKLSPDIVTNYTKLLLAGLDENREEMTTVATNLEFLKPEDSPETKENFLKIMSIIMEPFIPEHYSWENVRLTQRINEASLVFMKQTKFRAPCGEVLFLNRRLAGNVIMLEKLGPTTHSKHIFSNLLSSHI